MHSRELAELFFGKARQDEFALDKLVSDPASPDEVIGFHAQQAVEKMLKAVLVLHAVRLGKIHEIAQLLALLRENHIPYPAEFEELGPSLTLCRRLSVRGLAKPPRTTL